MGWEDLEDEILESSQEHIERVEAAEEYRTHSDPGESAEEDVSTSPVRSPAVNSQGQDSVWWVKLLKQHTAAYKAADFEGTRVRLISGCSGMLSEAFALKDRLALCCKPNLQVM